MPDTNDPSSIVPSAHQPAVFFIQPGISAACTLGKVTEIEAIINATVKLKTRIFFILNRNR